jgi:hypothetical protein
MYQAAWWAMGLQVTQFLAIMLAAVGHFSLLQAGLLFAGVQVAIFVASALYVRHKLPDFYLWVRCLDIREGLRDLAHSMMLTASNIIQQGATARSTNSTLNFGRASIAARLPLVNHQRGIGGNSVSQIRCINGDLFGVVRMKSPSSASESMTLPMK